VKRKIVQRTACCCNTGVLQWNARAQAGKMQFVGTCQMRITCHDGAVSAGLRARFPNKNWRQLCCVCKSCSCPFLSLVLLELRMVNHCCIALVCIALVVGWALRSMILFSHFGISNPSPSGGGWLFPRHEISRRRIAGRLRFT